jgi:hypothetical protein
MIFLYGFQSKAQTQSYFEKESEFGWVAYVYFIIKFQDVS